MCCSPFGHKESDMTERLNNKKNTHTPIHTLNIYILLCLSESNLPNLSNTNFAHQMYMRRLITTCLNPQKYQQKNTNNNTSKYLSGIHLQCRRHRFNHWVGKIPWRKTWQPTSVFFARRTPWTEESAGLQSIGSQRVGHD